MSSKISNPLTFGKEIEIIRQRFFIEYIHRVSIKHSEEYTMICKTVNEKGIDNIFISSPELLPNLKIYDSDGVVIKKQQKGWENKKGDPFYFNKTKDYTTVRIRPDTTDQILFTHSLKPQTNITFFPMFTLALLSIASAILFLSTQPFFDMCNIALNCSVVTTIAGSHIELGIGIIIASLALPHLIQNQSIRDSLTYAFIFPIILAIFGILFIRPI